MTKVKILLLPLPQGDSNGHDFSTDHINCSSRAIIKKISFKCNDEPLLSEQFTDGELLMNISTEHNGAIYTRAKRISIMTMLLKHLLNKNKIPIDNNKIKLYPNSMIVEKEKNQITNIMVTSKINFVSISIVLKIFDDIRIVKKYGIVDCDDDADYDTYDTKFIICMFPSGKAIEDINMKHGDIWNPIYTHIKLDTEQCYKIGPYDLHVIEANKLTIISLNELVQIIKKDDIGDVVCGSIEGMSKPDNCKMYLII